MTKYKKMIVALAAACMILSACTTSPPVENPSSCSTADNTIPSASNKENEKINPNLSVPDITECRYIHQMYYTPDCLCVEWSVVDGAANYEMEICDSDCTIIKTYQTTGTRISISANRGDDTVTGCVKGHKIRVRAIDANGNPGKWTEYDTVSCNSLWDNI